jgi:hypothetical protein
MDVMVIPKSIPMPTNDGYDQNGDECGQRRHHRRDASQETLPPGGSYDHLGRVRSAGLDRDRHGPHHFYRPTVYCCKQTQ